MAAVFPNQDQHPQANQDQPPPANQAPAGSSGPSVRILANGDILLSQVIPRNEGNTCLCLQQAISNLRKVEPILLERITRDIVSMANAELQAELEVFQKAEQQLRELLRILKAAANVK